MKRTKKNGKKIRPQEYDRKKGGKGSGRGGSLYKPRFHPKMVYKYALLGLTEQQIAGAFEVTHATIDNWKSKHEAFRRNLMKGKDEADAKVAHGLYQRAVGYSHPDVHISNYKGMITETEVTKHYPPDTTAAVKWLGIRTRNNPNPFCEVNKFEFSGPGGGPIDTNSQIDVKGLDEEAVLKLVELGLVVQGKKEKE